MTIQYYNAGTATVQQGSVYVDFVDTYLVTAGVKVGALFCLLGGPVYVVAEIVTQTRLRLLWPYLGATAAAQGYVITSASTEVLVAELAGRTNNLLLAIESAQDTALAGRFADGTVVSPGVSFSAGVGTGLCRVDAALVATVDGAERQRWTSADTRLQSAIADSGSQGAQLRLVGSNAVGVWLQSTDANAGERNWQIVNNLDAQGSLSLRVGASQGASPSQTRVVVTATGNLLVGPLLGSNHILQRAVADESSASVLYVGSATNPYALVVNAVADSTYNTAQAALHVSKSSTTGRSLGVAGTISSPGADYCEYRELIAALYGTVAKGALLGTNAAGLLTDRFADIVGRVYIKTTAPNLVGNDGWGAQAAICSKYGVEPPGKKPEDTEPGFAAWQARQAAFDIALETERKRWDRVAMCGLVPANIAGLGSADIGKYLVPVAAADGGISAVAIADESLTLQQYIRSFGVIENIASDGRPLVSVKIA